MIPIFRIVDTLFHVILGQSFLVPIIDLLHDHAQLVVAETHIKHQIRRVGAGLGGIMLGQSTPGPAALDRRRGDRSLSG